MNGILHAAFEVEQRLVNSGLRYCFIGGIALQRWGQPRTTLDVDLTVMSEFGNELPVIKQLLGLFQSRISGAAEFAQQSRVLLLKTQSDVGIDVALGALPFESRMINRASNWSFGPQQTLNTCSAEDLVVQKVFAGREQDWVDVANIITRQISQLDRNLIFQELEPLLELTENTTASDRLKQLFI